MGKKDFEFSLKREQLYQQVAHELQRLIVERSLRPGDKLPSERELAITLGVSRSVVREALRALAMRGLVKVKPGCGTYVCRLSLQDATIPLQLLLKTQDNPRLLEHLFEVRYLLEVEIAGVAAERATTDDIVALEQNLAEMMATQDPKRFSDLDLKFHLTLAQATHNELFPVLLAPVTGLLAEAIHLSAHGPGALELGPGHHRRIIAAVKARDPRRAREAMRAHIREAERLVEAVNTQGKVGRSGNDTKLDREGE